MYCYDENIYEKKKEKSIYNNVDNIVLTHYKLDKIENYLLNRNNNSLKVNNNSLKVIKNSSRFKYNNDKYNINNNISVKVNKINNKFNYYNNNLVNNIDNFMTF